MKTTIYVATQQKIDFELPDCYKPIFVGKAIKQFADTFGYCTDNTGNNISLKNQNYCELTALYWAWKNDDSDIIGLAHYRRYLTEKRFCFDAKNIISETRISQILEDYSIIVPRKSCLFGNVREQYGTGQHLSDYEKCGDVIKEMYPDYYEDFIWVSKEDSIYICNMFICKKELINNYCKWLFDILFELEKRTDLSDYTKSEKRIFGYLSERLFNVWIRHNHIKTFETNMLKTKEEKFNKIKNLFHLFCYKVLRINVLAKQKKRNERRRKKQ